MKWNRINKTDRKREKQGKVRFVVPSLYSIFTGKTANKRVVILPVDEKLI